MIFSKLMEKIAVIARFWTADLQSGKQWWRPLYHATRTRANNFYLGSLMLCVYIKLRGLGILNRISNNLKSDSNKIGHWLIDNLKSDVEIMLYQIVLISLRLNLTNFCLKSIYIKWKSIYIQLKDQKSWFKDRKSR